MSAARLREAAETMRREEEPVFDAMSDLLLNAAEGLAECERFDPPARLARRLEKCLYADALAVANAYLGDPGPVPSGPS